MNNVSNSKFSQSFFTILFITMCLIYMLFISQFNSVLLNNFLSFSGVIVGIVFAFKNILKKQSNKIYSIFIFIILLIYGAADFIWLACYFLSLKTPEFKNLITLFYAFSQFFLMLSIWYEMIRNGMASKIRLFIADIVIYSFAIGFISYELFCPTFYNSAMNFRGKLVLLMTVINLLSILAVTLLFSYSKASQYKSFLLLGSGLFCFSNLIFSITSIYPNYFDISKMDLLWPISMTILSLSNCIRIDEEQTNYFYDNSVINKLNEPIVILFLILIFLCENSLIAVSIFILLLAFRYILQLHLENLKSKSEMSQKFLEANQMLESKITEINFLNKNIEKKVYERTKSLTNKNNKLKAQNHKLKSKNIELYTIASVDHLSQLPNRRSFIEQLDELLEEEDSSFCLMFIDLDHFKSINDWYGHEVGDKLLLSAAKRIKSNIYNNELVARISGDEFVILLSNVSSALEAEKIATKILELFNKPFLILGFEIKCTISIGMVIYPEHICTRNELMKCADAALFGAKNAGRNTFCIYGHSLKQEESRRLEIERSLCDALKNNEFTLHYQPQFDVNMDCLVGIEALICWDSPTLGQVLPAEFIPIAEESGFILTLGEWIITESCNTIKYLNATYDYNLKVAVKIYSRQFQTANLVHFIAKCINETKILGEWLELEISEDCVIKDKNQATEILMKLKNLGIGIAIDDFENDFTSVGNLKDYPIDTLRIAKELIQGIEDNDDNFKIVRSIISMSDDLGLNTVALGVESEELRYIVRSLGNISIQGSFYSRPLSLDHLEQQFFMSKKPENKKILITEEISDFINS